jgi:hypothetical protein
MNLKEKKVLNPNKKDYKRLLKHYKFTSLDANNLKEIENITKIYSKEFLDGFYKFIIEFDYARKFLYNQEILQRHKIGIENWYLNLFCGVYDNSYFDKLYVISEIHVRIGLPAHYVNTAFSYVRGFVKNILLKRKLEK